VTEPEDIIDEETTCVIDDALNAIALVQPTAFRQPCRQGPPGGRDAGPGCSFPPGPTGRRGPGRAAIVV
jgi:hypothetical protein